MGFILTWKQQAQLVVGMRYALAIRGLPRHGSGAGRYIVGKDVRRGIGLVLQRGQSA